MLRRRFVERLRGAACSLPSASGVQLLGTVYVRTIAPSEPDEGLHGVRPLVFVLRQCLRTTRQRRDGIFYHYIHDKKKMLSAQIQAAEGFRRVSPEPPTNGAAWWGIATAVGWMALTALSGVRACVKARSRTDAATQTRAYAPPLLVVAPDASVSLV